MPQSANHIRPARRSCVSETVRNLLILALAGTFFFGLYQHHRFRGLKDPAAMDHAQLGRALAEGRGYSTRMLRPILAGTFSPASVRTPDGNEWPELMRPPVYPMALAAGFRLARPDFTVQPRHRPFAPELRVILPLGWLFTLMTAALLYITANRWFDRRIATLAPLVYLLSHSVLERSISGLPDAMATMLATAALVASLAVKGRDPDAEASWQRVVSTAVAAGILTGLAILCDYTLALFIPAPLIACALGANRRRTLAIGLFTAALAAAISPWMIRNLMICGNPFGMAHLGWLRDTAAFPCHRLERAMSWNPDALRIGALLRDRWLNGLEHAGWITRWCAGSEILFPVLALAALFTSSGQQGSRLLRLPVIGAAVLMLSIDPLLAAQTPGRLLYPLLPWLVLLGSATLTGLLDRWPNAWPLVRQSAVAAAILLHATPVIASLMRPRTPVPYPPLYPPFVAAACALIENDELMVTDQPWATAWYGNQRSLWLPNKMSEFHAFNDYHQTVAALYLTTVTGARPYLGDLLDGWHRDWLPLIEGRLPEGFPLTEGLRLPPGGYDQIVLIGAGRFAATPSAE